MIDQADEQEEGEKKVCKRWTASQKCWKAMEAGNCPSIGRACQTTGAKREARFGVFYPGVQFKLLGQKNFLMNK